MSPFPSIFDFVQPRPQGHPRGTLDKFCRGYRADGPGDEVGFCQIGYCQRCKNIPPCICLREVAEDSKCQDGGRMCVR